MTASALPLTALLVLGATPLQMGVLVAAAGVPVLLVGLFAGVWVDHFGRRQSMLVADIGRAAVLGSIPLAAALGVLHMPHLLAAAALAGVLTVCFDASYQSLVPRLASGERLLYVNARLATVESVTEITAPGLTGLLIQLIAAPLTIVLDALSFVVSAALVWQVRPPVAAQHREPVHLVVAVRAGVRAIAHDSLLRSMAASDGVRALFGGFFHALYALFALQDLGLSPFLLGATIGIGGASNLLGTALVTRVSARFGVGRTAITASVLSALATLVVPLAGGSPLAGFAWLAASQALDLFFPMYEVNALSLRQSVVADELRARVNAGMQVLSQGLVPVGALLAGVLAEAVGVRVTLLIGGLGLVVGAVLLLASPLRAVRALPGGAL